MFKWGKDLSLGNGASQSVITAKMLASTKAKVKSTLLRDVLTEGSKDNFLVAGWPFWLSYKLRRQKTFFLERSEWSERIDYK